MNLLISYYLFLNYLFQTEYVIYTALIFWIHSVLLLQDYYTRSQSDCSKFFYIARSLYWTLKFLDSYWILFCVLRRFYWSSTGCLFKHWLMMLLNIRYSFLISPFRSSAHILSGLPIFETLSLFPFFIPKTWSFLLLYECVCALTLYSDLFLIISY